MWFLIGISNARLIHAMTAQMCSPLFTPTSVPLTSTPAIEYISAAQSKEESEGGQTGEGVKKAENTKKEDIGKEKARRRRGRR
mmetsp:Transcript_33878/g.86969  ORF Transcript_33878/g.86969 Transcript_33878/m.86969 type:complete len:83 (-) Transcript_33878:2367-2615(-)